MKKLLALAASFGLLSSYVFAADLPTKAPVVAPAPPPAYNWTGFYIGLNGGYGIPDPVNVRFDSVTAGVADFFTAFVGGTPANANFSAKGGFGGGQVGYNWQLNPYTVVGLETDFQGSGIKDTGSVAVPNLFGSAFTFTASQKLNWFGTTRVRGGILATPNFLIYATGGFAWSNDQFVRTQLTGTLNNATAGADEAVNKGLPGWTVGGGIAYAVAQHWNAFAEYRHTSYGSSTISLPLSQLTRTSTVTVDVVELGLNYNFTSGRAAGNGPLTRFCDVC